MKKILFVEFLPIGGSSVSLGNLITAAKTDYECVLLLSKKSILIQTAIKEKIKYYVYNDEAVDLTQFSKSPVSTLIKYLGVLFYTFWITLKTNPALIYTNHYMWSIYTNLVGFVLRKPVIINLCDVWPLRPKISRILMKFNRRTKYIAVSKFVYNQFTKVFKVPKKNTTLIYDGVDENIFSRLSIGKIKSKYKNNKKIISYFSRVTPERDIEIFIDTAACLLKNNKNLIFYHCGYDPENSDKNYFNELNKRVYGLGIQKNFKFIKYFKSAGNIPAVMKRSFLTMVPARQFAIPNVAIESMMCGTPAVAFDIGGNPEIIINSSMGTLVKVNSPVLYADAIQRYLINERYYLNTSIKAAEYTGKAFPVINKHKAIIKLINQQILE